MAASYAFQRLNSVDDATHFIGLYTTPFLSAELKIDLIQLIAVYCKIDSIARRCREYLDKGGNRLNCYLKLTVGLHLAIGAAYKQDEWTFSAGKENKLALTLQGVVNVDFKQKVLFVEVVLNTSLEIKTELGMKIDDHPDGVDLVAYHDGIAALLALKADVKKEYGRDKNKNNTDGYTYKDKFIMGAPLSESKSPIRVNLLGRQRKIEK